MTGTLFGLLQDTEPQPQEQERPEPKEKKKKAKKADEPGLAFFAAAKEQAETEDEDEQQEVGYFRSLIDAPLRGLTRGIQRLGQTMGPLIEEDFVVQGGKVVPGKKFKEEDREKVLDDYLPQGDGFIPGALERAGEMIPGVVSFPGGATAGGALRIGAGATLGETVKQAGGPEWMQDVAEVLPFLVPDLRNQIGRMGSKKEAVKALKESAPEWMGSKIEDMLAKGAEKQELLDCAKSVGMTEAEITPLLQSETKQKWLSKLASKGESTQEALKQTKDAIGRTLTTLEQSPVAKTKFKEPVMERLTMDIQARFRKMPESVKAAIDPDWQKFMNSEKTVEDAIVFYRAINHELGSKTKQLATLKDPIKNAIMATDRETGRIFEMTNKLYSRFGQIAQKLKPNIAEQMVSASKASGAMLGLLSGNLGVFKGITTMTGIQKLSEKMLTSPRFQNLSGKMVTALNQGKAELANKIKKQLVDEVSKTDSRVAAALDRLNVEEVLEED